MGARTLGSVVMFFGLLLSGCLEGPPKTDPGAGLPDTDALVQWVLDAAGNPVDPARFGGELPVFDLVKISDRVSGEPTIGVTRTGAIFFPAIDFDVDVAGQTTLPSTRYMRSTDGGETWVDKSPKMGGVATHPTSFDPYVYVDPTTGRVFALDMGPHVACNKVSWSDDDGETWVTRDGACIPGVNDHPTIFAGPATTATNPAAYPNQVYLCTNQVTDSICYQSPDGGLNWIATTPPFIGYDPMKAEIDPSGPEALEAGLLEGLCGGLHGHGHASWSDGTVYLGRDLCDLPVVAASHDGGVTWTQAILSTEAEHDPADHDISVGTDREGNAYALWVGNGAQSVYLARSTDQGRSWETPINVTATGVTAVKLPSLVAGATGRIAFLYVGTQNPYGWNVDDLREGCIDPSKDYCYEHPEAYHNATWNAYIGMSLNADTDEPIFATVLANPVDEPLKRGGCAGRCFGDDGGMYDFLDIDIDPRTGQVWAALVDVCSADCDGAGKGKFSVEEKSIGVGGRMIGGTRLLEEEITERT